jgi:beta-xylosidase
MYPWRKSFHVVLFGLTFIGRQVDAASAEPNQILVAARTPHAANPILPGYFADPSLVQFEGKNYLYATLDPWGGETLGCWESTDFKNWTYRELNWPTKQACTSPTSHKANVWAPSVVRARDGKFYMYVSVGSEVWAGTADHPLGPWRNILGDRPLIPFDYKPGFHMIDAEAFIDDDGTPYLYWGSGFGWKNGKCWVAKLKPDMATFEGEVRDVTPANYFEGPFMVKHGEHYYLMYSQGKTITDTYQVRYAIGDAPFGPFVEAANSPILVTNKSNDVISPGHHAVFTRGTQSYILYHRHSIPFDPKFIGRQTCLDEMKFTQDGLIAPVVPTHEGPELIRGRENGQTNLAVVAAASSQRDVFTGAGSVLDDNYATRWAAATEDKEAWLQVDLGSSKDFSRQELRFEYAWQEYYFLLRASDDGVNWRTLAEHMNAPMRGSPVVIEQAARARYLRLVFKKSANTQPSLFEWAVYAR